MPLPSRHGNGLFLQQDTRNASTPVVRRDALMVEGSATSHVHHLQAGPRQDTPDGTRSFDGTQTTQVVQEAHEPIILNHGLWLVVRKPEDSPEAIRKVVDG